jgi:hypothetical protein
MQVFSAYTIDTTHFSVWEQGYLAQDMGKDL